MNKSGIYERYGISVMVNGIRRGHGTKSNVVDRGKAFGIIRNKNQIVQYC